MQCTNRIAASLLADAPLWWMDFLTSVAEGVAEGIATTALLALAAVFAEWGRRAWARRKPRDRPGPSGSGASGTATVTGNDSPVSPGGHVRPDGMAARSCSRAVVGTWTSTGGAVDEKGAEGATNTPGPR